MSVHFNNNITHRNGEIELSERLITPPLKPAGLSSGSTIRVESKETLYSTPSGGTTPRPPILEDSDEEFLFGPSTASKNTQVISPPTQKKLESPQPYQPPAIGASMSAQEEFDMIMAGSPTGINGTAFQGKISPASGSSNNLLNMSTGSQNHHNHHHHGIKPMTVSATVAGETGRSNYLNSSTSGAAFHHVPANNNTNMATSSNRLIPSPSDSMASSDSDEFGTDDEMADGHSYGVHAPNNNLNQSLHESPIKQEYSSGLHSPTLGGSTGGYYGGTRRRRAVPTKVSKYLLGSVMGSGVTCTVRDAIDISKNSLDRVAVKMLKRPERKLSRLNEKDRQHIEGMISNEVEMLQRFHHPNVMRALDCFTRREKEYVAMPIAVCSLQDFINFRKADMQRKMEEGFESQAVSRTQSYTMESRQATGVSDASEKFSSKVLAPAKLVKDVFLQILAGVSYLHSQNVHHNDLKPSNVLLFGDGNVKISDLGCSAKEFEVGRHGTPAYVSPQVVAHLIGHELEGVVSASEPLDPAKNDSWACGVILYQLLTGRLPYGNPSEIESDRMSDDILLGGRVTNPPNGLISPSSTAGDLTPRGAQVSEFTVYSDIVHKPIDFDWVLEEESGNDGLLKSPSHIVSGPPTPRALRGLGSGHASGKALVKGLLCKKQSERLSITEALHHPWLQDALQRTPLIGPNHLPPIPNLDPTTQTPKAPGASHNSTATLKRVFDVEEIKGVIERDFRRHMQHVAEVCFILRLELPKPLFKTQYNKETRPPLLSPPKPIFHPSLKNCLFECVQGDQFIADDEMRHFASKGRPDCDIATLRNQLQRRISLALYVDGIVRICEDVANGSQQYARGVAGVDAAGPRSSLRDGSPNNGNGLTNANSPTGGNRPEQKTKSLKWCCF